MSDNLTLHELTGSPNNVKVRIARLQRLEV